MRIDPIPVRPAGNRADPAKPARPRPEQAPRPHRTACVSLPPPNSPAPASTLTLPTRHLRASGPSSLLRRGPLTHGPRGSSGGSRRLRPSLRAQSPAAPGTASYSPDIRNTPSPELPGACSSPPLRSVTALGRPVPPYQRLGPRRGGPRRDESLWGGLCLS
ncbi:unnamed protein product [Rangifer tarandus platyrhynchus]|uniref:Uncharacterized protein n=2 Tax=Rangifer tarandus platyrhynchus TaxID=3082113 RepID=A0ABN8ZYG2_RANTA|nr:unnamed protein product [Rangifer tarandus platyrhynchus]CAI9711863.1 unnamed protein product [Rangifer tarandus platyrhynchus]